MISESAAQAEDRRAIRRKLLANKRNIPTHYGGNLDYQAMFASVASTDSHSPTNQKFNNESHGSTPVLASLDENNASVEVSSKELEKARKLAARKVRNRLSAEASRKRVRDEIESLTAKCEFLQDQVASLKDRLSRYEAVEEDDSVNSEVFMTKSKKSRTSSNNNGSSFQPSNNCSSSACSSSALMSPYIEPAVFIGRPQLAFRIDLLQAYDDC